MSGDKPATHVPTTVTSVDMKTGKETVIGDRWMLMPAPEGTCPYCAVKHKPHEPHNAQSMFYQVAFTGVVGRAPTWADAMEHCGETMKAAWKKELSARGAWTEPPGGEMPVKHHGIVS